MRRTKIVATVGPHSRDSDTMRALLEEGVDVLRINFAHGDFETHEQSIRLARKLAGELGKVVGILIDLPGPKMRSGPVEGDEVHLESGQEFSLLDSDVMGSQFLVGHSVDNLTEMVSSGDEIFLADGEIVLRVEECGEGEVRTHVVRGGTLHSRKGMHLPQAERHIKAFTPEDEQALQKALELDADLVGLSFVRDADDVARAKAALPKRGHRPLIVAKIETRSALDNLHEVVEESDVVMVARGDLGIQLPLRRVPLLQKEIIRVCNGAGTPVITATQLLSSMTRAPIPTRAEVTDVANALIDGTDAVMLSEETAVGDYPAHTVRTMAEIAESTETFPREHTRPTRQNVRDDRVSWAVAHAAVEAAEDLGVSAILCATRTGATARRVAGFRPRVPIVGLSYRRQTLGSLTIYWGVKALQMPEVPPDGDEIAVAVETAAKAGVVHSGDLVCVVAGAPGRRAGGTDFVRVVRV